MSKRALDVVVRLAKIDERKAMARLGRLAARVRGLEAALTHARAGAAETIGARVPAGEAIDVPTFRAHDSHRDALAATSARIENELVSARAEAAEARIRLARVQRKRSSLEDTVARRIEVERAALRRASERRSDDLVARARGETDVG